MWWHDIVAGQASVCEPEWVNAEHPLFLSIHQGPPAHQKASNIPLLDTCLERRLPLEWVFDLRDDDVFWCTADVGWDHRPQLCGLWSAGEWRDRRCCMKAHPRSRCRPLLEDHPGSHGQHLLHSPHGYPRVDETRRCHCLQAYDLSSMRYLVVSASQSILRRGCGITA